MAVRMSVPKIRLKPALLALSAAGLISIASYEGFRATTYLDSGGVPTIGYGTTDGVKPGQRITPDQALAKLGRDVGKFEKALRGCIGDVPLYPHEWDAYVSLAYNIGTGAFCRSTLVKKLKAGDYEGACREILRWDKVNGKVVEGLRRRREAEYRMCMGEGGNG